MLKRSEEELLRAVDLVFCSSQGLQGAKSRLHRNCFLIPNGVDMTSFPPESSGKVPPPDMQGIRNRSSLCRHDWRMGRFGWLIGLARARPDWSIVLIGPLTAGRFSSLMAGAPNIHWLGEREYKRLPAYLTLFDVCLIPFKLDEFTEKIYPTKFHQYLGAGKPVVSSPLPELARSVRGGVLFGCQRDGKESGAIPERGFAGESLRTPEGRQRELVDRRVDSMIQVFNAFLRGQVGST